MENGDLVVRYRNHKGTVNNSRVLNEDKKEEPMRIAYSGRISEAVRHEREISNAGR